jgi:hypothetical protein
MFRCGKWVVGTKVRDGCHVVERHGSGEFPDILVLGGRTESRVLFSTENGPVISHIR